MLLIFSLLDTHVNAFAFNPSYGNLSYSHKHMVYLQVRVILNSLCKIWNFLVIYNSTSELRSKP